MLLAAAGQIGDDSLGPGLYDSIASTMDPESLIALLVARSRSEDRSVDDLLGAFENSSGGLFDFLAEKGFGDKSDILRFVAEKQGRDLVDLEQLTDDPSLLEAIGPDLARIFECVPLEVSESRIKVSIADPFDHAAVEELSSILGKEVEVAIADPDQIAKRLSRILSLGTDIPARDFLPQTTHALSEKSPPGGGKIGALSPAVLAGLGALALGAVGLAAVVTHQSERIHEWRTLVAKNETLLRQSEELSKNAGVAVAKVEREVEQLESLLGKKEVDAIRVDAIEKDLRKLLGKMEALGGILAKVNEPASEAGEQPAESQAVR